MAMISILIFLPLWIGFFAAIAVFIVKKINNKDTFTAYTSERRNYRTKIPAQTNQLSQMIRREQAKMQQLDEKHKASSCKYTYTTQDPNFSFDGLPNDYDDFAELRKKNTAHERHLQRKIY